MKETIVRKGRSAAIFRLFDNVNGSKKMGQDPVAMIDPVSKQLVFDPSEIKQVSLNYCSSLLQKSTPDPEYEREIFVQDRGYMLLAGMPA